MTERFLSLKEVGERLGVKNPAAKGYNLSSTLPSLSSHFL